MIRVLACGLCVTACADPAGVFIHVGAKDAKAIELFIGNARASDPAACNAEGTCSVTPVDTDAAIQGVGWIMASREATRVEGSDGAAWFKIEPDANAGQTVPALLAVAFDGAGVPIAATLIHDLEVPAREAYEAELVLAPISSGDITVTAWRRPTDLDRTRSACAIVTDAGGRTELFVPGDDTDCDDATVTDPDAAECSASTGWAWCRSKPQKLSAASCVTRGAGGSCRLGAPPCADRGPGCPVPEDECVPTSEIACLPSEVCDGIEAIPCDSLDPACLRPAFGASTQPIAYCHLYYDSTTAQQCPPPMLDGNTFDRVLGGRVCTEVKLAAVQTPLVLGDTVAIAPMVAITLVPDASGSCIYELSLSGAPTSVAGNLAVDLVTGPAPEQHRLVHLGLQIGPTSLCDNVTPACAQVADNTYAYRCE